MKKLNDNQKIFIQQKIDTLEQNIEAVKNASMFEAKAAADKALDSTIDVVKCLASAVGVYDE